jgi:alpha-methylacyl-CoA racemase
MDGVRVLEVSRLIPGALTGWWLAALGAEVVKFEEPGTGDYVRAIPPYLDGQSVLHLLVDRGKKSVSANLGDPGSRELLLKLMGAADVVIDGMRPGALSRYGIDYAAVRKRYPDLVVCSVTGFGQMGPMRDRPAHGMTIDSTAGIVPVRGDSLNAPTIPWELSNSIGVECGASSAVIAILGALLDVRNGRGGAWLDVALWDAAVHANRLAVACALTHEVEPPRVAEFGPLQATYRCSDGRYVMLALIEWKFWERFCHATERPDLLQSWDGQGEVGFGADGLGAKLAELIAERRSADWESLFRSIDVPANVINDVADVVGSEHFAARALAGYSPDPDGGPTVGAAVRWMEDGTRLGLDLPAAPPVGRDTEDVAARWTERDGGGKKPR